MKIRLECNKCKGDNQEIQVEAQHPYLLCKTCGKKKKISKDQAMGLAISEFNRIQNQYNSNIRVDIQRI